MSGINTRILGRTGMGVSEFGLGTWPLSVPGKGRNYGGVEENKAIDVLKTYVDGGGNFLDSAFVYNGVEAIIGKYLKQAGNREQLIITSKTQGGEFEDTLPKMDTDLEQSLKDLGTDYVDIYFLHLPPDEPAQIERAIEKMLSYKRAGKIRAIGASIKGPNVTAQTQALCDYYIGTGHIDVIQVVYNILRQRNLSAIERAQQNNVGVVVRTVLESGFLTGAYSPGHVFKDDDHRARYDRKKLDTALKTAQEMMGFAVQPPYQNLPQVALHFALRLPGLSCLIMGAQNPEEVLMN
ncbi:MAG: aldo/keto reductase, partial [Candidatus Latescibacteria bacterium]|nr:aldo/keto reductase [Candidatus Latescibacterota bacterium]